ncbi:hypothetical protein BDK51DRAFT_38245 [Blyttiomyces helicus]|uniref:Uncharacterized protein n=1 Tax=Blyttiomyces helicus TaxID=388810 RepID=A0A4P9WB69_9FUNG|nr:hypothetical protein BDK51DRAFT_38245 [Blyttiomyces helicus]|eukprot:RKO88150.1 hypothetical protein BDK51DRAFT_38245 [Blyttiomyces helicus]
MQLDEAGRNLIPAETFYAPLSPRQTTPTLIQISRKIQSPGQPKTFGFRLWQVVIIAIRAVTPIAYIYVAALLAVAVRLIKLEDCFLRAWLVRSSRRGWWLKLSGCRECSGVRCAGNREVVKDDAGSGGSLGKTHLQRRINCSALTVKDQKQSTAGSGFCIISFIGVAALATASIAAPQFEAPGIVTVIGVNAGGHCASNVFPKRLCNEGLVCQLNAEKPSSGGVCIEKADTLPGGNPFGPPFGPGPARPPTASIAAPHHVAQGPVTIIGVNAGGHCASNVFPKRLCNEGLVCQLNAEKPSSGGVCIEKVDTLVKRERSPGRNPFGPPFGPGPERPPTAAIPATHHVAPRIVTVSFFDDLPDFLTPRPRAPNAALAII